MAQFYKSVKSLESSGFVITWQDAGQKRGSNRSGVYTQVCGAHRTTVGSEININSKISGAQPYPDVTDLEEEGFLITWQSDGQHGDSRCISG